MGKITVVGLGPGGQGEMTLAAWNALNNADRLVLRTARHGAAEALARPYTTLDTLYDQASDMEELAALAADKLAALAETGDVTYAVPGHGLIGDDTVGLLVQRGLVSHIVPGMTQADATAALAMVPAFSRGSFMQVPASRLRDTVLHGETPLVITQLDDPFQAGDAALLAAQSYGEDAEAVLTDGTDTRRMPLFELPRQMSFNENSAAVLGCRSDAAPMDFADLVAVIEKLRAPGGCPWDREQTHESLHRYLVEECYEVLDALGEEDWDAVADELGDVMLQVIMHAVIGQEEGEFTHRDVTDAVCRKMIRRHPHVFGDEKAENAAQVLNNWENIKAEEKQQKTRGETMAELSKSMPSVLRAQKVQEKAAHVGFDWPDAAGVFDKMQEELAELQEADDVHRAEEAGDVLFTAVNLARRLGFTAEELLNGACDKFVQRFTAMENALLADGIALREADPGTMNRYWEQEKVKFTQKMP